MLGIFERQSGMNANEPQGIESKESSLVLIELYLRYRRGNVDREISSPSISSNKYLLRSNYFSGFCKKVTYVIEGRFICS